MGKTNDALDALNQTQFGDRPYVADGIFRNESEDRWDSIHPKVLFVLKQPNSDELLGEDYRDYGPDVCFPNQVWSQLLARLHGIMQATQGHFLPYEEAIRPASLETAWHQYPFAAINLNKEEGAGTTNPTDLHSLCQVPCRFYPPTDSNPPPQHHRLLRSTHLHPPQHPPTAFNRGNGGMGQAQPRPGYHLHRHLASGQTDGGR